MLNFMIWLRSMPKKLNKASFFITKIDKAIVFVSAIFQLFWEIFKIIPILAILTSKEEPP